MTTEPSGWVRVSHELIQQMCDDLGYTVEFHDDHTATVTAPNLRSTRVGATTKSDAPAVRKHPGAWSERVSPAQ